MHLKSLLLTISLFSLFSSDLQGQKIISELGGFVGTSYYNGDLNPSKPFVAPHVLFGGIYKLNLNTRYAIKTELAKSAISGQVTTEHSSEISPIHQIKTTKPTSFNASMVSFSSVFEINFVKYDPISPKHNFTPFMNLGFGFTRILNGEQQRPFHFSVPMGFGVKYMIKNTYDIGLEYSLRKTFSDAVDGDDIFNSYRPGIEYSDSDYTSVFHNNDWYTYISLFITIKFINFAQNCPAYD